MRTLSHSPFSKMKVDGREFNLQHPVVFQKSKMSITCFDALIVKREGKSGCTQAPPLTPTLYWLQQREEIRKPQEFEAFSIRTNVRVEDPSAGFISALSNRTLCPTKFIQSLFSPPIFRLLELFKRPPKSNTTQISSPKFSVHFVTVQFCLLFFGTHTELNTYLPSVHTILLWTTLGNLTSVLSGKCTMQGRSSAVTFFCTPSRTSS